MRHIARVILVATLFGCGQDTDASRPISPDVNQTAAASYTVVKYSSSLGGTQSRGMAINSQGWVAGWSNLADGTRHSADRAARCLGPG